VSTSTNNTNTNASIKAIVYMSGGTIIGVDSTGPVEVLFVDSDTEGAEKGSLVSFGDQLCCVAFHSADCSPETARQVEVIFRNTAEDELTAFVQQQIEDGQIDPEDLARKLVRCGLMDPAAFVAEMRERKSELKGDSE
jgi:hypothetical protein